MRPMAIRATWGEKKKMLRVWSMRVWRKLNLWSLHVAVSHLLIILKGSQESTLAIYHCSCSLGLFKKVSQRRQWHPTPVLLPGKPHGQRSLVGCSPWGREEWDTTERLNFHFSLSCTGEGNGNPLQCSCLENPRDGGAWWAAVYGVAQSRMRLKRVSSSSSKEVSW